MVQYQYSIDSFYMCVVNVMAKYSHVPMYSDNGHCIFVLGDKIHRTPGDWWMIHGPTDYIPRTEIGNTQRRLDFNQCNTTHTYIMIHMHISLSVDISFKAKPTHGHCKNRQLHNVYRTLL